MITAHRIIQDSPSTMYFAIKVDGEWLGTAIIEYANREVYSFKCYDRMIDKGLPLKVSWLEAIKRAVPHLPNIID